jgi:hypothetical protein
MLYSAAQWIYLHHSTGTHRDLVPKMRQNENCINPQCSAPKSPMRIPRRPSHRKMFEPLFSGMVSNFKDSSNKSKYVYDEYDCIWYMGIKWNRLDGYGNTILTSIKYNSNIQFIKIIVIKGRIWIHIIVFCVYVNII